MGTENFGNLLRDPAMAISALVARELAERGFGDLRPGLLAVATHIRADGWRVTDLAQRAQVSKPTVVHAVDELVRLGYARREPDPADGRAKLVTLTERALEAERVGREAIARIRDAWAGALGEREMAQLEALLLRLRATLSAYIAKMSCSASTLAIAARQMRWSRRIARARRLWASTGSSRRPRRTAAGTVLPPARAIATSASGSEPTRASSGCRRARLHDDRGRRGQHRRRHEPVHRPGARGHAGVVGGDRGQHRLGQHRAAVADDLDVEHEVEPEDGEQEAGAGGHEGGHGGERTARSPSPPKGDSWPRRPP